MRRSAERGGGTREGGGRAASAEIARREKKKSNAAFVIGGCPIDRSRARSGARGRTLMWVCVATRCFLVVD